jgi:hypothetical protein
VPAVLGSTQFSSAVIMVAKSNNVLQSSAVTTFTTATSH